jgi:hypothetical protein
MGDYVDHPECSKLIAALRPLADAVRVEPAHWISTPEGEYTHSLSGGSDWCRDCGAALVRHLRRRERNRKLRDDYVLDGGWPTEHETPPHCAHCGVKLEAILLTYGALDELEHFRNHPPTPGDPVEAYEISEMLSAFEVTGHDDHAYALEAIEIARTLVAAIPDYREGM